MGNIDKNKIDLKMLRDNIVDLFVNQGLVLYNAFDRSTNGSRRQISAKLLGKVKYQDEGHSVMGVWAYLFSDETSRNLKIPEVFDVSLISGKGLKLFNF